MHADAGGQAPGPAVDAVRFAAVSEGLRDAFVQLGNTTLAPYQRSRWQRRLIAITDAARRDLPRAQAQLEHYREDWRRQVDHADPSDQAPTD